MTSRLFTSAIMHSATSMNLWALSRKAKKLAFSVAKTFLITSTNSSIVVAALRNVEYKQLQTIAFVTFTAFTLDDALAGLNYGPVIEPDYDGALFVNKSEELLSQGGFHRIPTIMGFTSNEASAFGDIPRIIMLALTGNDLEPQKYAPVDLTNKSSDRLAAGVKIKMHYFGLIGAIVASRFVSDDQFNRPIRKAVLDQSKYAPVYCYEFSYEGLLGGVKDRMYPGVGHAEDIGYLFRTYNITRSKKMNW
ncbi:hypothetical protein NQ318_010977 [Aromia moschata]|uniref:Carboxylesterase type B domain-containing protein n=1 Tax=Aromia moschata TaxID=1265417 RepID=A0AAV8YLD4_9CUCU|nr:hypothetical protein NQ318_010977 [Aromia moschata]